jgi:two-component system, CitB family, sensor kinase
MRGLMRRLWSQIFAFQVLILAGTALVGVALAFEGAQGRLDREYEQRALAVARTVAAMPEIQRAVAAGDRGGVVQRRAEAVRRSTRTAFVVVTDDRGIRYSHPRPERIGQRVSTDPAALTGRTVLAVETGTLGRSARAKVPLRGAGGRIVGQVSVGVLETTIRSELVAALPTIALYAGIALAVGMLAAVLLARRLKRQTFGLELGEIADLLQEREAMLHGIREGVVAVDTDGRLRVVNDEARRLLGLAADVTGRSADEVADGRLADLLAGRAAGEDLMLVHDDRLLIASRRAVAHEGRAIGAVVTLRDRTELEELARELDSVRGLTDAMRAQAHEYSNRLHTVSGLLELGHHGEAIEFIRQVTHADAQLRAMLAERVDDVRAAALLLAKSTVAAERGVALRLAPDLRVRGRLSDPPGVLSVLGNLIDNALDAARGVEDRAPWVEVGLATTADGALHIHVADSGPGVPPAVREQIFEPGWSTKPPSEVGARGVGLPLVRRIVERHGGEIAVSDAGDWGGAVFEVRLPEAVRAAPGSGDAGVAQPAGAAQASGPGGPRRSEVAS